MSLYTATYIEDKLKIALGTEYVKVEDASDGCGAKFDCVIVSNKFEGLKLLDRHRLVNSTLAAELKTIHAFSQKTLTPDQWKKQNKS